MYVFRKIFFSPQPAHYRLPLHGLKRLKSPALTNEAWRKLIESLTRSLSWSAEHQRANIGLDRKIHGLTDPLNKNGVNSGPDWTQFKFDVNVPACTNISINWLNCPSEQQWNKHTVVYYRMFMTETNRLFTYKRGSILNYGQNDSRINTVIQGNKRGLIHSHDKNDSLNRSLNYWQRSKSHFSLTQTHKHWSRIDYSWPK